MADAPGTRVVRAGLPVVRSRGIAPGLLAAVAELLVPVD